MAKYDFVIVGSGLWGAVFAREAKKHNQTCLVLEKRGHIAGNCYTENKDNIHIHKYGPHIFHTNSKKIWDYVNTFGEFNNFINKPKVIHDDKLYSFPINLMTLNQLWGTKTPEEARLKLEAARIHCDNPKNLEEWVLSQVGQDIYNKFIYGYTKKQWGTDPKNLPTFIIKRLPIRLNYDENYYFDQYQGIPINGYTNIIENMLDGIEVRTNTNYLSNRDYYDSLGKYIVYTGPIDQFFDYQYGELEYRSLRFEHSTLSINDYQGNAIVNYTNYDIPYTRTIEHKHFTKSDNQDLTHITTEYPQKWTRGQEAYYPINNDLNNNRFQSYKSINVDNKYIFGGRLAEYKYYDMHQVIGSALNRSEQFFH